MINLTHINKGDYKLIDKYTVEHKGQVYKIIRVEPATGDVIAWKK
jgi:hypothetical protein